MPPDINSCSSPAPDHLADRFTEREMESRFWPKLRRVAAAVPGVSDILALYFYMKSPLASARHRLSIMATLAYFILPIDAIPDFLAGFGYTDDIAVALGLIRFIGSATMEPYRRYAKRWLKGEIQPDQPLAEAILRIQEESAAPR